MAMINATSLRGGSAFLYEGKPYKVTKYSLIKMGRGGATVKVNCVNLETGSVVEHAFSSNLSFETVELKKRTLQYLFRDASSATFMDSATFDQVEVPLSILGDAINYVKEGENANVLFWGEKALSIDLPPKVILKVTDTDPGVKGNSVSNLYKPATLENGLTIKVPLFINRGEKIRVDTRTGEYIERAQE